MFEMGTELGHRMHILDLGGGFPGMEGDKVRFEEVSLEPGVWRSVAVGGGGGGCDAHRKPTGSVAVLGACPALRYAEQARLRGYSTS